MLRSPTTGGGCPQQRGWLARPLAEQRKHQKPVSAENRDGFFFGHDALARQQLRAGGLRPEERMQAPFDIAADLDTPVSAYLKLAAMRPRFLLESVEGGERLARYSFLGFGDAVEVRMDAAALSINGAAEPRPQSRAQYLAALRRALELAPRPQPADAPAVCRWPRRRVRLRRRAAVRTAAACDAAARPQSRMRRSSRRHRCWYSIT